MDLHLFLLQSEHTMQSPHCVYVYPQWVAMNAAAQQSEEGLASWHVYQVSGLPGITEQQTDNNVLAEGCG